MCEPNYLTVKETPTQSGRLSTTVCQGKSEKVPSQLKIQLLWSINSMRILHQWGVLLPQKARDLAIEYNFDTYPTMPTVPLTPDQCTESFQFHTVLEKDIERIIKSFRSNKAPGYDKVLRTAYQ